MLSEQIQITFLDNTKECSNHHDHKIIYNVESLSIESVESMFDCSSSEAFSFLTEQQNNNPVNSMRENIFFIPSKKLSGLLSKKLVSIERVWFQ